MQDIPPELTAMIGQPQFAEISDTAIETGAIRLFAAAVEDGCPAYWAENPDEVIAPPAMLSAWNRPLAWMPGRSTPPVGMALHFLIKERLALPDAVVTRTETAIAHPARPGMKVRSEQVLVEITEPRRNRLGEGRYWSIRVDYRCAASGELLGAETLGFFGYRAERAP